MKPEFPTNLITAWINADIPVPLVDVLKWIDGPGPSTGDYAEYLEVGLRAAGQGYVNPDRIDEILDCSALTRYRRVLEVLANPASGIQLSIDQGLRLFNLVNRPEFVNRAALRGLGQRHYPPAESAQARALLKDVLLVLRAIHEMEWEGGSIPETNDYQLVWGRPAAV